MNDKSLYSDQKT